MRRILIILATLMGAAALAQANPILVYPTPFGSTRYENLSIVMVIALIAVALEYAVFRYFTAKVVPKFQVSLGIFLIIHLISLPLTQLAYIGAWILNIKVFNPQSILLIDIGSGVLAEAVPITLEALWYFWIIRRLSPRSITMKRAWTVSLLANASSYVAGLAMFHVGGYWF